MLHLDRLPSSGGYGMTFSGGTSASAMVVGDGHGNGKCQTYEGAVWAVS